MQQQHPYVLGDWTVPQHPHAPVGLTPSLHLWPHGPVPSSNMLQSEDHSGRLSGKNAMLQQPENLHLQSQYGESFSGAHSENWLDQNASGRGPSGSFAAPSSAPTPTAKLHRLMLAQFGQVQRDPRMQSMMPYCPPYSSKGWAADDAAPPGDMSGDLHLGRSTGYSCDAPAIPLTSRDMQHKGTYMSHDSPAMYNGMPNGVMHSSTPPGPVTDLRTCAPIALQPAVPVHAIVCSSHPVACRILSPTLTDPSIPCAGFKPPSGRRNLAVVRWQRR